MSWWYFARRRRPSRCAARCWRAATSKTTSRSWTPSGYCAGATEDLEQLSPLVRALGSEAQATETHRAAAAEGHTFLVAYAPSELDTERLMNVARRVGYVKAHKYDRFTISDL
jgi:hypothetical protein